jgi:hypothetical protein
MTSDAQSRAVVACALWLMPLACSSNEPAATGGAGTGGATAGSPSVTAGGGATNAMAGATSAGTGGATAGSGGAPSADAAGSPNAGAAGTVAAAGSAGVAGSAGASGGAGPTSCAGHALSLAANTTGMATDTAHALVSIDLQTDLPIGNADRTIEFWMYVKPTDWVAEKNEVYVYGTVGTLQQIGLDFGQPAVQGMPNNHATLGPYTDGVYDDDTGKYLGIDSTASQWLHVAMTWDGANTTLRTYVNGALRITTKSGNATKLITTASLFYLGCNPPYYGCFNGLVDELRVWNVLRTDTEIMSAYNKALVGNEPGLVGYWKFDEAPGSLTAADSVTTPGHTAHTGTLMAATAGAVPTFVTPDPLPSVACP